jgi:hypothetical protein
MTINVELQQLKWSIANSFSFLLNNIYECARVKGV